MAQRGSRYKYSRVRDLTHGGKTHHGVFPGQSRFQSFSSLRLCHDFTLKGQTSCLPCVSSVCTFLSFCSSLSEEESRFLRVLQRRQRVRTGDRDVSGRHAVPIGHHARSYVRRVGGAQEATVLQLEKRKYSPSTQAETIVVVCTPQNTPTQREMNTCDITESVFLVRSAFL